MGYLSMFSNIFYYIHDRVIERSVNNESERKSKEGIFVNWMLFSHSTGGAEVNHDYSLSS
jgi:hypothetical protein